MPKVVNINGMSVTVFNNSEKEAFLSQEDIDMDIRAREAVRAALDKAKVCGKPIARYDTITKRAFIEYADGTIRFVE